MKKMKIAVELDGTTTEFVVTPRAQVDFERKFDIPLDDIKRMDHIYFLAWSTMKSAGATTDDYESWLGRVEGATAVRDDAAPLGDGPSDGS